MIWTLLIENRNCHTRKCLHKSALSEYLDSSEAVDFPCCMRHIESCMFESSTRCAKPSRRYIILSATEQHHLIFYKKNRDSNCMSWLFNLQCLIDCITNFTSNRGIEKFVCLVILA